MTGSAPPAPGSTPPWLVRSLDTTGRRGGEIRLGVVDGRPSRGGPTYVIVPGFLAFVEAFEMQRFQLIAAILRARLIVVEPPGAGMADSRLLPDERRALLRGDFTVLARRMLRAASTVLDEGAGAGPVGLMGYSMGASFAAAAAVIADEPEFGLAIGTVVLVEPVAVQKWNPIALYAAMRRENLHVQPYLDETSTVAGTVPPLDRRPDESLRTLRRTDLLLLANALRAARLSGDLTAAAEGHGCGPQALVVVRGEGSVLAPEEGVRRLVATAEKHLPTVRFLEVAGPHAFWLSMPRVNAITTVLRRTLEALPS